MANISRVVCQHLQDGREPFLEELLGASMTALTQFITINKLCPVCTGVGFAAAIGQLLALSNMPPDDTFGAMQEVILALQTGHNSQSKDVDFVMKSIDVEQVPKRKQ